MEYRTPLREISSLFKNLIMKAYTIFLDKKLHIDCTDDMASTSEWADSGRIWLKRKQAQAFIKHYNQPCYSLGRGKYKIIKVDI